MSFFTVRLTNAGVELLDQRKLPTQTEILVLQRAEDVARAIEDMVVRGAPAIGVTAAMGLAVELRHHAKAGADGAALAVAFEQAQTRLAATRPTAVNLVWALERVRAALTPLFEQERTASQIAERACELAQELHDDDVRICRAIGEVGAAVVPSDASLLTHCNAGALATAGYGTALGVVRSAAADGNLGRVLACETRPFLQGARLTAWELAHDGIPVQVITDSMAGGLMAREQVDVVVVGADRIAANGDVANKVGTYSLAVLAKAHEIPFYVAAPLSTIDPSTPNGAAIPIEQRASSEVTQLAGVQLVPEGVEALHPAFDVTPAALVTAILTEAGVVRAPYPSGLAALFAAGKDPSP